MKILVLSSLYPDEEIKKPDRQTPAVHNFLKFWIKENEINVLAVKLHYFPLDEKDFYVKDLYYRDDVPIESVYIFDRSIGCFKFRSLFFFKLWLNNIGFGEGLEKYNRKKLIARVTQNKFIPDVIVAESMLSFKEAYTVADYFKVPYILGFHRSDVINLYHDTKWAEFINKYKEFSSALVARSPLLKKMLRQKFKNDPIEIFTAISGIDPEEIESLDQNLSKLKEWKNGTRSLRLVSVCFLMKLKNVDINLRAIAELPQELDFTYEIIGDGEERRYLEELSKELGISSKVKFHGKLCREEVLKILTISDIFILVSAPETLGLVYLEAFAKGNIVVGAIDNGIHGVATNKKDAFFVHPRNVNELTLALKNIIFNVPLSELLKILTNSHKLICSLSEEKVAGDYLNFIRDITKKASNKSLNHEQT